MSPSRAMTQILARDPRYAIEAYALVLEALDRAARKAPRPRQGRTSRSRHVTGRQLCLAARDLMRERYGLLAAYLLRRWGVHSTSDLGEIVYALIASGDLCKTERDSHADFDGVFDFDQAFGGDYRFPEAEGEEL